MNLGVDLGSTYSSFSTYDIVNKNVELCKPVMSEPEAIPSIACLNDDGKMLTGYTARKYIQLDDPSARTFSAFKMLLTESNEKLLQERGFGTDYTPSAVAETFLRDQVNKILSSHADPGVDNLVICAPEVWTTQSAVRRGQLDGAHHPAGHLFPYSWRRPRPYPHRQRACRRQRIFCLSIPPRGGVEF